MAYSCKILADSIAQGVRLTTLEVSFPRPVLAELNTHRMLSRNSASSRAIPVEKMIAKVMDDPFIPISWGKNQRGMQATEEFNEWEAEALISEWLGARDAAVKFAKGFTISGVHKQIVNRLLEPFLWHTAIVSATEWENFFALRCHKDAMPEIRRAAEMMRDAMMSSEPRELSEGDWHLPLNLDEEHPLHSPINPDYLENPHEPAAWVSAGRCARVSYLTHDGKLDPDADEALGVRLAASGHMSPLEHPAQVHHAMKNGFEPPEFIGNFRFPWVQLRKQIDGEDVFRGT